MTCRAGCCYKIFACKKVWKSAPNVVFFLAKEWACVYNIIILLCTTSFLSYFAKRKKVNKSRLKLLLLGIMGENLLD